MRNILDIHGRSLHDDLFVTKFMIQIRQVVLFKLIMNSMQTCNFVTFYFMKNSFSDVSRKWLLTNMIRAGTHGIHD